MILKYIFNLSLTPYKIYIRIEIYQNKHPRSELHIYLARSSRNNKNTSFVTGKNQYVFVNKYNH